MANPIQPLQPPGPRHGLQAYFAFRRDPLDFLTRIAAEYGDIVHMQVGNRHDYLLNHPDLHQASVDGG